MIRYATLLIALLLIPGGCSTKSSGSSGGSSAKKAKSGGSSKYGTNAFGKNGAGSDSRTGTWTYSSGAAFQNSTCGKLQDYLEDYFGPKQLSRFLATDFANDKFSFIEKTLNKTTSCTEGSFFSCNSIKGKYDLEKAVKGTDAVLDIKIKPSGSYKSATSMDGKFDITIDCEGRSCGLVETTMRTDFPCSLNMRFQASHPKD